MRAGALLVVLGLLLMGPHAQAWDQAHGTAARDATAILAGGPLDVQVNGSIPFEVRIRIVRSASIVETPIGLVMATYQSDGCSFVVIDLANGTTRELPVPACPPTRSVTLLGYDAASNAILTCHSGGDTEAVLVARDLMTLDTLWDVVPVRDFQSLGSRDGSGSWDCRGAAIDHEQRRVVAPFVYQIHSGLCYALSCTFAGGWPTHRVASFALDGGALQWDRTIQATALASLSGSSLTNPRNLAPSAITLTPTGVVVLGMEACDECVLKNGNIVGGFLAWFDETGTFRGYRSASLGGAPGDAATSSPPVSEFAVTQGPVAAAAVGGKLVILNPGRGGNLRETPIEGVESTDQFNIWQTPAWLDDIIVIPLPHSLSAFDATSGDRIWSFTDGADHVINAMIPATPAQVLVLQENFTFAGGEAIRNAGLVRVDARTGAVLSRLHVPITPKESDGFLWSADLAALSDGRIFLLDGHGRFLVLGPSLPTLRPTVGLSDLYPPVGARVEIAPTREGATRFNVNWGDGDFSSMEPGESASHTYVDRGDRDVQVTAYFADGRTATTVQTVFVGTAPPAALTPLQRAFSPENQELTFFVLGAALTILGAAYTVGRHRRRLTKLERELAAVEEIRMLSTHDPRGAVLSLKTYRDHLPEELARRRIDDSQYSILEIRSARLLKVLRTRMFAPYDARLSPRYHRLLDAAFEDAIIQHTERDALVAALEGEPALRPGDVAEIVAILDDFTTSRSDAPRAHP